MKTVFNLCYKDNLYMDLFLPEQKEFFTIIHFHGGGLIEGDKGDSHEYCKHLADQGFAVFTANYSLLPNNRFPSFCYDAAEAVKYAVDNISKYGKSKGIIISGQSAGAYLTLMLCFNKEYLSSVGINSEDIISVNTLTGEKSLMKYIVDYEWVDGKNLAYEAVMETLKTKMDGLKSMKNGNYTPALPDVKFLDEENNVIVKINVSTGEVTDAADNPYLEDDVSNEINAVKTYSEYALMVEALKTITDDPNLVQASSKVAERGNTFRYGE